MHLPLLLRLSALLAALIVTHAAGQNALEIIGLRHRTAEQVLPALRPLMEPGATLTGQGTQLIVRTSAANLAELRRALEAIDRPLRRLQISVRFDDAREALRQNVGFGGRVTNREAQISIEAREGHGTGAERIDQRIQVLEGGRAHIATGQSTPILDGSVTREAATGFDVLPRLAGNTVTIDIVQRREALDQQQGLVTTLSAPLGQWIEVASAIEQASRNDRGIASRATGESFQSRRVWLKVEEVRP